MADDSRKLTIPSRAMRTFMFENTSAFNLVSQEIFDPAPVGSATVYLGVNWTPRYLGIRADADLYLGAGTLR